MTRKLSALCLGAMVGLLALLIHHPAFAWWVYGGPRIGVFLPPVVIGPPVVVAPPVYAPPVYAPPVYAPPVYAPPVYVPPPVAYAAPRRIWIPGSWYRGTWIPGHWN